MAGGSGERDAGAPGLPRGVRVVQVDSLTGRSLRKDVLRPGSPPAQPTYPAEDAPSTLHFAAVDANGAVVSVGSVMPDPHPRAPRPGDWRVRGMATREQMRGRGLGAAVLERCERAARERGGERLWCNARVGARGLYERAGFVVEGDVFELPEIGPHLLMSKLLA